MPGVTLSPSKPRHGRYQLGDFIHNSSPNTNGGILGWTCTSPGIGDGVVALSGITATTTSGSNEATITTNNLINKGDYIKIVGETFGGGKTYTRVVYVFSTNIHFEDDADNGVTGATVSWQDAEFKHVTGLKYDVATNSVSTSSTAETDLMSTTVIAGSMSNIEGGFRIHAAGTKSGDAGNKTIKFYWGSNAITFHAAANNTNDWRFEATVMNTTGPSQQRISWIGYDGTTVTQGFEEYGITSAITDIEVKITGETADAGDSITQQQWLVEGI